MLYTVPYLKVPEAYYVLIRYKRSDRDDVTVTYLRGHWRLLGQLQLKYATHHSMDTLHI